MAVDREAGKKRGLGVYVHIPFCASKCPYCDFNSIVVKSLPEKRYTDCLVEEFAHLTSAEGLDSSSYELRSLYIGGGTPTLFSGESIKKIVSAVREKFPSERDVEVTIEANPGTIGVKNLRGFIDAGVRRINMGWQSLSDDELRVLGRSHSASAALDAFHSAREAGFENIGVDLIFGVPGQSLRSWEEGLTKVIELRPEHVSLYNLTLEKGTPFYSIYKGAAGARRPRHALVEEGLELEMYGAGVSALKGAGYMHYEISNFALPEKFSRHNSGYWLGRDFLGIGAGAYSYMGRPRWGRRFCNYAEPAAYMEKVESRGHGVRESEVLERPDAMAEAVMLGLRMLGRGIAGRGFRARFGAELWEGIYKKSTILAQGGLVRLSGDRVVLAEAGLFVSNEVMVNLLP